MGVFITVNEAAEIAGVRQQTINYHISKSRRLKALWDVDYGRWYVCKESLERLYPDVAAGRKQKLNRGSKGKVIISSQNALKELFTVKVEPVQSYASLYETTRENLI